MALLSGRGWEEERDYISGVGTATSGGNDYIFDRSHHG
jgi:hypothetical protein